MGLIFSTIVERMKLAAGLKNDSELARELNITPQALSNFKRKGEIPTDLVIQFADKFKLSVDWLRTGHGQVETREPEAEYMDIILEKMIGQMKRIYKEKDFYKLAAIQSLLSLSDPEKERDDK
jgi:transcriptional regulator with XRE-family HTH domain